MKIYANTLSPNFKKIIAPEREKYSHKQEAIASQVRFFAEKTMPNDKNNSTYVDYLDKEFDSDILLLPGKTRNHLELYAYNKKEDYKSIITTYSPKKKPTETDLNEHIEYSKLEIKESNNNFISALFVGALLLGISLLLGNTKSTEKALKDTVNNTEIKAKTFEKVLTKDTLELTQKVLK